MRDDDHETQDRSTRKRLAGGLPLWAWAAIGGGSFAILALVALAVGVLFLARDAAKQARGEQFTYTPVTPESLGQEWRQNAAAAATKYRREGIEFTGTLSEISSNIHGQTYVNVRDSSGQNESHIFVLTQHSRQGLEKCRVGARVTVKARTTGEAAHKPWLEADDIRPAN